MGKIRANQKLFGHCFWTIQAEYTSEYLFLETRFFRLKKNLNFVKIGTKMLPNFCKAPRARALQFCHIWQVKNIWANFCLPPP